MRKSIFILVISLLLPIVCCAQESIQSLKNKAQRGDAEAQYNLAARYAEGEGVAQDYKQTAYWLMKAAEQGNTEAQLSLGVCYYKGFGVTVDLQKAKYWVKKAADQGNEIAEETLEEIGFLESLKNDAQKGDADAQYELGFHYSRAEDYRQAVYWWRKAAEQGYAKAQLTLGVRYYKGEGVDKDYQQAVYWIRKAAEQGNKDAQYALGVCYYNGEGVAKDLKQAVYWYRKAAEQGDENAQFRLGVRYYKGEGVAKDLKQAAYWYRKAADQGHEKAKEALEEIEKESQSSSSSSQAKSSTSSSSSGQVHDVVEQWPQFPGGQSALFQFLSQNIHYPEICEKKGIQGRVICSCVVDTDGSITDVQVKQSVDPNLDREAVRVIQSMPKWTPGKQKGKPVRVRYTIPITFRLQ